MLGGTRSLVTVCRRLGAVLLVMMLCGASGCYFPSQTAWSPDGSRAAYMGQNRAYLIDPDGTVLATLGPSLGGFAWTPDGSTLYFTGLRDRVPGMTFHAVETDWLPAPELALVRRGPASPGQQAGTVSVFRDGKTTPLFELPTPVWRVLLSPDGQWLVAVAQGDASGEFALYAYHLADDTLHELCDRTIWAACFTGPNRVAFAAPDLPVNRASAAGQIVEVSLPDGDDVPERTPLFHADLHAAMWLASAQNGDLLVTQPMPPARGKPAQDDDALERWSRQTKTFKTLAEHTGPFFLSGPDGNRVLYEQLDVGSDQPANACHLAVMSAVDGGDRHELADLTRFGIWPPAWPAWRSAEEISFCASTPGRRIMGADRKITEYYDLVRYKLTPAGELQSVATLSEGWPLKMKPTHESTPPAGAPSKRP